MATPTKAKQVKAAREANAQTATSQEIFEAIQKHGAIIQAGEILEATAKHIGADEIGRMLAEVIKGGNTKDQKLFLQQFMQMTIQHQKAVGQATRDEYDRLTEEQLDSLIENTLKDKFGLEPNGQAAAGTDA